MSLIQIWNPPPVELFRLRPVAFITFAGVLAFRIPTPDSRLTVSLSLLFTQPNAPAGTVPFDATFGATVVWPLWLAGRDADIGGSGAMIPTVNLLGTKAAPQNIPTDVNIDGFSDDFTGGQDEIYGELTVNLNTFQALQGLRVSVQVRYEPGPCAICDDEWLSIIQSCTPFAAQPPVSG